MGNVLAPIEGTPYVGGTAQGVVYVDANGLQTTDGPTWDGNEVLALGAGGKIAPTSAATDHLDFSSAGFVELTGNTKLVLRGGPSASQRWEISGGNLSPVQADNQLDLGSTTYRIKDGYFAGVLQAGILDVDIQTASDVGLSIEHAATPSGDYLQLTTNGGTAGDVLKVDSAGDLTASGFASFSAPYTQVTLRDSDAGSAGASTAYHEYYYGEVSRIGYSGIISGSVFSIATTIAAGSFEVRTGNNVQALAIDNAGDLTASGDITASGDRSSAASDGTGKHTTTSSEEVHTLAAAATSDTTTISVPSGARLLGVSFTVNTAVVDDGGDDTWSAAFVTGSTTTLATAAAAALNTKVDLMLADEITTGVCQIRFTANGGSFSAGVIEVVAYFETLTSLANA